MTEIIEKYSKILGKSRLFSALDGNQTAKALEMLDAKYECFKKGRMLHSPFKPFKRFGFVLAGHIKVCSDDMNGDRMIMATVGPGVTFGESLSFLSVSEPPVYVYADEDSEVLWLSSEIIFKDDARDEFSLEMQKRFTGMIAERALVLNTRIQILSKLTLREKIIALFTASLAEGKKGEITLPFGRDDMAAYLGTNRSALSRELSRMKKDGIIDYRKNEFIIKKK